MFADNVPDCNDPDANDLCPNPTPEIIQDAQAAGYPYYIGHAEPTVLFFSTTGTSGYNQRWKFQLPATDPNPTQDGSTVANFELSAAFWIGMALCDPNSNPFGACTPLSDANNPTTAGAAFLELQFYPPGSPFGGCNNTQWCARLHINTLQNNNAFQKANCLEPTTQQYITTDGTVGGTRLLMNNGDTIIVTITDTPNGMRSDVNDQTTSTTGFMVASGANGFVHNANQTDCATEPFDFRAMYATAAPGQVVPWATLNPNISFDFEIGHWELCAKGDCSTQSDQDADDPPSSCGTVRGVGGCTGSDTDHDGSSYQAVWPDGNAAHPATLILGSADDRGVGPLTTSTTALTDYDEGYNQIKFMTTEGTNGAFYPYWTQAGSGVSCKFNFGNTLPGTTNDFGKAAQYGTTIDNPCMPGTPPVALCQNRTVSTDPNTCSTSNVSIDNGSNDATDGDPLTFSQAPAAPYALGMTLVTLTVTEPEKLSNSCTATVNVVDNQKPNITCPTPTVECTGPGGAPVVLNPAVTDNCPGVLQSSCVPPSGSTFPLGTTPITCNAKDASGNTNSCNSTVKVVDTTPPTITDVSASPNALWAPNHKMVPVSLAVSVTDICDPNVAKSCLIVAVTSNEPVLGAGSGNTSPDWEITGALTANLRAERSGLGDGRIYTLTVQCTDASKNSSTKATTVQVPHDQGGL